MIMNIKQKTIIIAKDVSEYYKIEVIEQGSFYVIYEWENLTVKKYRTANNKEIMFKNFVDLYLTYKVVDKLSMHVTKDLFGLGVLVHGR